MSIEDDLINTRIVLGKAFSNPKAIKKIDEQSMLDIYINFEEKIKNNKNDIRIVVFQI